MKPISFTSKVRLAVLFVVVLIAFTACTKLCRSGYEGNHCDEISRLKFEGVWSAIDTPGNLIYTNSINSGSGIAGLIISNSFAGNFFSHAIYASANGATISIAPQQPDSNQFVLQGTGTINVYDSIINWSYKITNTLDSPIVTTNYTGVWTK